MSELKKEIDSLKGTWQPIKEMFQYKASELSHNISNSLKLTEAEEKALHMSTWSKNKMIVMTVLTIIVPLFGVIMWGCYKDYPQLRPKVRILLFLEILKFVLLLIFGRS